jgi:hypothetical protein
MPEKHNRFIQPVSLNSNVVMDVDIENLPALKDMILLGYGWIRNECRFKQIQVKLVPVKKPKKNLTIFKGGKVWDYFVVVLCNKKSSHI